MDARRFTLTRRTSIPIEMEDPEDCTVGEAEGDLFEPKPLSVDPNRIEEEPQLLIAPVDSWKEGLIRLPKELRNILAGGIAGMMAKTVVAPVDRIKILYQVSNTRFHLRDLPVVARNIVQKEGFFALWKGNSATMLKVFPYSGIQFTVFEFVKHQFLKEHEKGRYIFGHGVTSTVGGKKFGLTPLESLVGGMIAGTCSVICTYPLDLVRAQLAVLMKQKETQMVNPGFWGILVQNYSQSGMRGLYRGLTPTLLGIIPYAGVAFALNEQGKRKIQNLTGREVTTMERIQCGAFAGLIAQTLTYPIEVTRRRMQTAQLQGTAVGYLEIASNQYSKANTTSTMAQAAANAASKPPASLPASSMVSVMVSLYKEQGFRGFMKGVTMNWLKGPVAFAISFTVFDSVQGFMESDAERARRLPSRFQ